MVDLCFQFVDKMLRKYYNVGCDLGCGIGTWGPILKKHCSYLIGVDRNPYHLKESAKTGCYSKLVLKDIRFFQVPLQAEIVFMFDVIEHLPKQDGINLLHQLQNHDCIISTPSHFFPITIGWGPHVSLWTVDDFKNYDYDTYLINTGWKDLFFGKRIVAYKTKS